MFPTASSKLAGMFEPPPQYGTPPIAPTTIPDQRPSSRSQIEAILAGYKKPSMGKAIGGAIADALAQFGGFRGAYGAAQGAQQERQTMLQDLLLKADMEQEQWAARERMKAPDKPAVQQNYEYLKGVNPAAAEAYISNFGAPPMQAVDVTNPDGSVERRYIQRPPSAVQPAPQGPVDWSQFKPKGGQTPPASGGFRKPY